MKIGETRKFYNPYVKDDQKTKLTINLNKIKQEFSHYPESFIMESLVRVSNDLDDLKLFLSDTVKYIGKLIMMLDITWTEVEDKILQSDYNNNSYYYNKIYDLKGVERIKKRIDFLNNEKSNK
jgi:hypothetical protein